MEQTARRGPWSVPTTVQGTFVCVYTDSTEVKKLPQKTDLKGWAA